MRFIIPLFFLLLLLSGVINTWIHNSIATKLFPSLPLCFIEYARFNVILLLLLFQGKVTTELRCGGRIFFHRFVSHLHVSVVRHFHVLHFSQAGRQKAVRIVEHNATDSRHRFYWQRFVDSIVSGWQIDKVPSQTHVLCRRKLLVRLIQVRELRSNKFWLCSSCKRRPHIQHEIK